MPRPDLAVLLVSCLGLAASTCVTQAGPPINAAPETARDAASDAPPSCADLQAAWQAIVAADDVRACQVDADCGWVGGPRQPTCHCTPAIGTHQAVNRAAYAASPGPELEAQHHDRCGNEQMICDAAPPMITTCVEGVCQVASWHCCLCSRDAGSD